jgi:scyllo-inositol 2-dehydrogenase (NADP+)
MSKKLRVALAAYGMSGRLFHAPFLQANPDFELIKILERSRDDSRAQVPEAEIVRSYDAILQDTSIDLVIVNTPNALHYSMTKSALLAGKHVIVEKPFTPTVAEGEELVRLAEQQGLMLSVYHNRRFASGYCTAKHLLAEGCVGELKNFTINLDRYRPEPGPKKWKEEDNPAAGLLYDIGIHLLDESLLLFGLPDFLTAELRVQRKHGKVNDYFRLRLDYVGFQVMLNASLLAREPAPAYIIHGDKGSYIKPGQDIQEAKLLAGIAPLVPGWAKEHESQWGVLNNDDGRHSYPTVTGDYRDFYQNIHAHLRVNEPLLTRPEQALDALRLIDVALLSSQQQRTLPVRPAFS